MGFGEAKLGPAINAYPHNLVLGTQQIRPLMLDQLEQKLGSYELNWTYIKFVAATKDQIPDTPGVYFFIVNPQAANIERHYIILYFGKAKHSLNKRYSNYLREREGKNNSDRLQVIRMLNIYKDRIYFAYCCLDEYDVEKVEDALLLAFHPPCNTVLPQFEPAF